MIPYNQYSVSTLDPTLHTHPHNDPDAEFGEMLWLYGRMIECIVLSASAIEVKFLKTIYYWEWEHNQSFCTLHPNHASMGVWTKLLIENGNAISNIWFKYNFINNLYVFVEIENCISCAYVASICI